MRRPTSGNKRSLIYAALLGLASVLAFAPLGAFPLMPIALGGLFHLLNSGTEAATRQRCGALIGGAFGLGLFLGGVSWVYVSLSHFGGLPAPLAGLATLLFCAFLALYPALAGAIYGHWAPSIRHRPLFFAALWTLGEWLRGWVLTGFPWLAIGYSQTPPSPLGGFAPILGVYGLSFVTAWVGASLSCAVSSLHQRDSRKITLLRVLPAIVLIVLGGLLRQVHWTQPTGQPISVALLQGNIAQEVKWRPEWFETSLRTYYDLMRENPAQLTVFPETAIPAFLHQLPPGYLDSLRALALRTNGDLLLGVATGGRSEYTNSVISVGASGMQRYDKVHLVPFGEFVPPGFRWFMDWVQIPMSDFKPGANVQEPLQIGGLHVAPNICYEDAFGEEIIRALPKADLLVNLSNVAWFGDSLAPAQHLQISQMRAMETGRMMLRATNTGMTAIIETDGSVRAALRPFTRAALTGEVRAHSGETPYQRWGNTPSIVLCLLLITFLRWRNAISSSTTAQKK